MDNLRPPPSSVAPPVLLWSTSDPVVLGPSPIGSWEFPSSLRRPLPCHILGSVYQGSERRMFYIQVSILTVIRHVLSSTSRILGFNSQETSFPGTYWRDQCTNSATSTQVLSFLSLNQIADSILLYSVGLFTNPRFYWSLVPKVYLPILPRSTPLCPPTDTQVPPYDGLQGSSFSNDKPTSFTSIDYSRSVIVEVLNEVENTSSMWKGSVDNRLLACVVPIIAGKERWIPSWGH